MHRQMGLLHAASARSLLFLLLLLSLCLCAPLVTGDYTVASLAVTAYGYEAVLSLSSPAPYGGGLPFLSVSVWYETDSRLRVAIRDANSTRWEIPQQYRHVDAQQPPTSPPSSPLYRFVLPQQPGSAFSFQVLRAATGRVLFDTSVGAFHDSPQYIEISTAQPADASLYGFGERILPLRLPKEDLVIWTTDWANPTLKNLYGHHRQPCTAEHGSSSSSALSPPHPLLPVHVLLLKLSTSESRATG
jgi:alpha-glucosidase (family GH31 glycosyl hydrolase)